jgi:undecaprenyl-diphosphatase
MPDVPTRLSPPQPAVADSNDPVTGEASLAGWGGWALRLLATGQRRLAGATLTLVVGCVMGVGALFVFADLAEDVMERQYDALDHAVLTTLQGYASPVLDSVALFVSLLGSEAIVPALILVAGLLGFRRRWGAVVSLLMVTAGAQLLNDVLKDLFHRTRPAPVLGWIPAQQFSFPSGHAMVAAAFYLFLAYLAWRLFPRGWRVAAATTLIGLVLLIGLSRLYLGVHYFTDVVAGYIAGFIWTDTVVISGRLLGAGPWRRAGPSLPRQRPLLHEVQRPRPPSNLAA